MDSNLSKKLLSLRSKLEIAWGADTSTDPQGWNTASDASVTLDVSLLMNIPLDPQITGNTGLYSGQLALIALNIRRHRRGSIMAKEPDNSFKHYTLRVIQCSNQ